MHCKSCGVDNPSTAKFCIDCAAPFPKRCPQCGTDNPPHAKFCAECGMPLATEVPNLKPQAQHPGESGVRSPEPPKVHTLEPKPDLAERRQLTVMFCDLVGSTALSTRLDPEEWRDVVQSYQVVCTEVIRRYEGYIAQYLGDGLLVYFGYPAAHEDDAQRAVRAGLEIVAAFRPPLPVRHEVPSPLVGEPVLSVVEGGQGEGARISPITALTPHPSLPLQGGKENTGVTQPLQVRIGIHTGVVVVGEIGGGEKREQLALGETPNIAARMQGLAEPDTVVLSITTYRLVQGLFECQDLGPQEVKGLSTLIPVFRVVRESRAHSRFDAAVSSGLTPLVGREEEGELLHRRWARAKAREGQVVLLSGEAGIGKSRLVQELKEQVVREEGTRIEFRCSPHYQNSALYPLIEHLQRLLQFHREDTPQAKLVKLERGLQESPLLLQEVVPLFAALLSLPHPEGYPELNLSPQKQKQKTQEALVTWLLAEAETKPVLAAWEDLHWADPSTLEVLSLCLDRAPTARLLLLLTFRPDFHPPWAMLSHLTQLTLSRLGRNQVEEMVKQITDGKALPEEVLRQIVSKTDGVPLFVEELTKMVMESGLYVRATPASPLPPLAIPVTLQDALMARLDRLGRVKEVAQLGATIGREFSYELIHAVSRLDEATLTHGLKQLVEAELVYQRGLLPQTHFLFKHALIQDAAYQSLLKSTRQQYHQQIAEILEKQFPEQKETQPELLAHHYTEAGCIAQAVPYWQQAGQRAVERSAYVEAISHLTKGLELLKTLPEMAEHARLELALQVALGMALTATKSWAAPEVGKAYARARALSQQVGETSQLFPILWGLWQFSIARPEYKIARELAEELLSLAQSVRDSALLLEAHFALGFTLDFLGELGPARSHLEQALILYDSQQYSSQAFLYGQDPGVACLSFVARTLWLLGYPDQALRRSQEALTLAQKLGHPHSLAFALGCAAWLHQYRREGQAAQEWAEAARTISTEHGFAFWAAWGDILESWARAEQGYIQEGFAPLRQGLAAHQAAGTGIWRPYLLALLAEAHEKARQSEEGLAVLAEALDTVNKTGERFFEAELYRLQGQLTLQSQVQGPKSQVEEEAEDCFRRAIAIARQQQAKSLELRAVISLSRLWQSQGKQQEAHDLLVEIYGWFTEGFDTKDLQEAQALLTELQ